MVTNPSSAWSEMPMAVQSFSLEEFNTEQVINHARNLGFTKIDFFPKHLSPRSSTAEITRIRKLLNRAGMEISAYGLFTFSRNHDRNKTVFDFATLAGIRNIVGEVDHAAVDAAPVLNSAGALADEYNVRVCIHTSGPNSRYEKLNTLVSDLRGRPKNLGVCIDTGHILRSGGSPEEWISALNDRVFAVHLTDVAQKQPLTHSVVLGTGHLDLGKVLASLQRIRFPRDGSIAVGFQASACARLMMPPGDRLDAINPLSQISRVVFPKNVDLVD